MNNQYYEEIGLEPCYTDKELHRELELHDEEKVDSNLAELGQKVLG